MSTNGTNQPLRILMIHGLWESGPMFRAKVPQLERALQSAIARPIEFSYITATHMRLAEKPFDPDHQLDTQTRETPVSYGWVSTNEKMTPPVYDGLDDGLALIAKELKAKGPFEGVMGFSQGGFLAALVASLLESGREKSFDAYAKQSDAFAYPDAFRGLEHPPLHFVVDYSGYAPSDNYRYGGYYQPKIATPMLHFIGTPDEAVVEARTMALVGCTVEGEGEGGKRIVRHPNGHVVPVDKQYVDKVTEFVRETC